MQGNNVLVYVYSSLWSPIGCTKTNNIQTESEMIEVSSPTNPDWMEYIEGRKGWSITTTYLVLDNAQIKDVLKVGQKFRLAFCPRGNTNGGVSGYALLKNCHIDAQRGNLIKGTFTFQGTGELA